MGRPCIRRRSKEYANEKSRTWGGDELIIEVLLEGKN